MNDFEHHNQLSAAEKKEIEEGWRDLPKVLLLAIIFGIACGHGLPELYHYFAGK